MAWVARNGVVRGYRHAGVGDGAICAKLRREIMFGVT